MSAPGPARAHALVVAKAPVPGFAKTRLGAEVGMQVAAELAAAALLDTIAACSAAFDGRCHLALDGDLVVAPRGPELLAATRDWEVFDQGPGTFAERLARAHRRVSVEPGAVVVQVGMDTPQVTDRDLLDIAAASTGPDVAVLGPATDGGWWALGLRRADAAAALLGVPMSEPTTGQDTARALEEVGLRVVRGRTLTDVDTVDDAAAVAALVPGTRFGTLWNGRAAS